MLTIAGLSLHLPGGPRCPRDWYGAPPTAAFNATHLQQIPTPSPSPRIDIDHSFLIGNFPILPLRTRTRGPAYTLPALPPNTADIDVAPDSESYDCVDEILSLFRANVLFRNFEINGPADRMLIYGTLFVSECLGKVKPTMTARDAEKVNCYRPACVAPNSNANLTGPDQCRSRQLRHSR